jgi:hypothetical protein
MKNKSTIKQKETMKIKNMTKRKLEKILIEIMPSTYFDKSTVKINGNEIKAKCTVLDRDKVWFYIYQDEKKKFVVCMDGAFSYDLISTDAEFGQDTETVKKFYDEFEKVGYYPDPNNHYSFTLEKI